MLGDVTLGEVTAGQAFTKTFTATGGVPPVTFAATGIPAGLALDASSGVLSGTPSEAGDFSVSVTATDSEGTTAVKAYPVKVHAAITITTTALPEGNVGTAYAQAVQATGGKAPLTFSHTGGTLPPGLSVGATGALTGTPTVGGAFTFTVSATDANLAVAGASFTVTIYGAPPPRVTTTTLPNGVIGAPYAANLAGADGETPYAWTVSSGALPPGLNLSTTGALTGTPTAEGTASFQVQLTDTNGQTARKGLTLSVYPALNITTTSLAESYVGDVYPATTLAATGGQAPFTWAIAGGNPPPGVTLTSGGVLSGTATAAGAYGFTVSVTDGSGQTDTQSYAVTIYDLPSITTASLADGIRGAAYSQTLAASGGKTPRTFALATGSTLPAGLTLNSGSGQISGTPTTTGSTTFTVQVTDANLKVGSRQLTLSVYDTVAITTGTLRDGYVGDAYTDALSATGGNPGYTWSISAGALPAGVSLDASTGALSGTPTGAGTASFTVRVQDASGQSQTKPLAITVFTAPTITTTSLSDAYRTESYSASIAASGGKPGYSFQVTSGAPPAGITLGTNGVLSGTTTATGSSFTVTVTDANGKTGSQALTLATYALPSVSTTSLADAYVGTAYSRTIAATGGKGPLTYALQAGDSLPGTDLTLNGANGQITGTPTAAATSSFTVVVTDANGRTASSALLALAIYNPPQVSNASLPDGTVNVAYSQSLNATGGKGTPTWSLTAGALPVGLSLSTAGVISGTPTAAGSSTFTVTATDANSVSGSRQLTIAIFTSLTVTSSSPLQNGYVGAAYANTLTAAGGKTPYAWALASGALPGGVTLSGAGALSGSPTSAGTSSFTVSVTDANGTVATKSLELTTVARPSITTVSLVDGYVSQLYAAVLAGANGKLPYAWDLNTGSGALPEGATLDPSTGELVGTPTTAGSYPVTVRLTDANGLTATRPLTIAIYSPPVITTASALADGYVDSPSALTLAASGGKAPLGFVLASGTLPPGLTLSSAGDLSGVPATAGSYSFSVRVTDANGQSTTRSFTQAVRAPLAISTTALADGYVGTAYARSIVATGGRTPYTFTAAGTLPPGVTLSTSGALGGTPTAAGTHAFDATVTDANGVTAVRSFSIATFNNPQVTTTTVADAYMGSAYSATLTATGGKTPLTWALSGGALPGGLTLGANGAITGTATESGSFAFNVVVSDANGIQATAALTMAAHAALELTTTGFADAYQNEPYSSGLAAAGGKSPYTFSLSSGTLPIGLTLTAATGAISGTPTVVATSNFTARVADANAKTASRALSIAVLAMPALSTTEVADGYVGTAYSATLAASGGRAPYTFARTAGTLPTGVTLSSGGALSGTPAVAGSHTFTVTVTDANGRTGSGSVQLVTYEALQVTTASLADGYPGTAYTATLAAFGGKTPITWSSTALPAGLALSTAGALSGTPTTAGTSTVTFTARDGNGVTATRDLQLAILAVPSITTTTLPDGYPSRTYTATVAGSGGRTPYSFTSTALPAGLTLASTGELSGTPTTAGSTSVTFTLTDGNGRTATKALTIVVREALQVTTASLPDAYQGTAYSQVLGATGGLAPHSWSISSGTLPAGITLDAGTGTLAGTPTASGTSSFTVRVTDANNVTATRPLTVQTYVTPAISTASPLPAAYQAVAYSVSLTGTGGKTPYTWVVDSGTLPAGLTLSTAGLVSGTPTATGTSTFTVRLSDANGQGVTKQFTLTVNAGFNITTTAIDDGYEGRAFTQTLAASGGATPYTGWAISAGALPPGLTLNAATGVVSGTPGLTGSFNFTVRVQDANSTEATKVFTQIVFFAPAVTTAALPDGYVGETYSQTLASTGGKAPKTWAVTAGTLPAGVTLTASTGALTGSPTAAGSSTFTVTVTDANGVTDSKQLTTVVYAPPSVAANTLPEAYQASSYTTNLLATGGKAPLTWSITTGALPAGVTLTAGSGALTGTPTTVQNATFTATVTDANGRTAAAAKTINVLAPLQLTTAAMVPAYQGVAYSHTLAATGGGTPYAWDLSAGSLPPGVTLNATSGVVSGTPTTSGTYPFTARVTDRNNVTATKALSINVAAPLSITTTSLADAYVGAPYSRTIAATGGRTPYTFVVASGTLPAGMTLATSGELTGPATTAGSSSFVVRVTDDNGTTATQALTLAVYNPVSISSGPLPEGYQGEAYSGQVSAAGGKSPYTYAVTSGALPAGLSLNSSTGEITGSPPAGTFNVSITATDANGASATAARTIQIWMQLSITVFSPPPTAYVGDGYNAAVQTVGGKPPLNYGPVGTPPPGVFVDPGTGNVGGVISNTSANGASYFFGVRATDANGRTVAANLDVVVFRKPSLTTTSLTVGTEGVTYMRGPGLAEQLEAIDGQPPYLYSASGLPASMTLTTSGVLGGTPLPGDAGNRTIQVTVRDSGMAERTTPIQLQIVAPRPIVGGGQLSVAPGSSKITNHLTVFVVDPSGNGLPGMGVRLRKNGGEFSPVKQALTDGTGKAFFDALGLNGTTDTVDVTVNGAGYGTRSVGRVNAALVTVAPLEIPALRGRYLGAGAFDPTINRAVVATGWTTGYGGGRDVCSNETIRINSNGTATEQIVSGLPTSPSARYGAAMAYAGSGRTILYGGYDCVVGGVLDEMFEYQAGSNTWERILNMPPAWPGARYRHAMASDNAGNVYLYGGGGAGDAFMWRFDPNTRTWTQLAAHPTGVSRSQSRMAFLASRNWIVQCGGSGSLQDCYAYDITTNTWNAQPPLPTGRYDLMMAPNATGTALFAFGGRTGSGTTAVDRNDLLVFDGLGWTTVTANGAAGSPPPRNGGVAYTDTATGEFIVTGGRNQVSGFSTVYHRDVWAWNGTAWTRKDPVVTSGFTVSGTISNGPASAGTSFARVYVGGSSGFLRSVRVALNGGSGTYAVSGVPSGDSVHVLAVAQDTSLADAYTALYESNLLGPIVSDTSHDFAFPASSTWVSTTATVVPPADWGSYALGSGSVVARNPGLPGLAASGTVEMVSNTSLSIRHLPPPAGLEAIASFWADSADALTCEYNSPYRREVSGTPTYTLQPGARNVSPGLGMCRTVGSGFVPGSGASFGTPFQGFAAGRVDGDNITDVVFSTNLGLNLAIGDAWGGFFVSSGIGPFSNPGPVELLDLNGDGRLDLAFVERGASRLVTMLSLGAGTFGSQVTYPIAGNGLRLAKGDLNGDGRLDLVVAHNDTFRVEAFLTQSTGFLQPVLPYATFVPMRDIAIGDLTGDGLGDVAMANQTNVTILRLAGNSLVQHSTVSNGLTDPQHVAVADISGEGRQDLIVANGMMGDPTSGLFWYLRQVDNSLPLSGNRPTGGGGLSDIYAADFTGDGTREIVAVGTPMVEILTLSGGTLNVYATVNAIYADGVATAGEFNGDGEADLIIGFGPNDYLATYLSADPIPTITEGTYAFTLPPAADVWYVSRGPRDSIDTYYEAPFTTGTISNFTFPLPSTLAPSRPTPSGQHVVWSADFEEQPSGFDWNHFKWRIAIAENYVGSYGWQYTRQ